MPYPFEQQDASGADITIEATHYKDRLRHVLFPKDKGFWALTEDGDVLWLHWSHDHWLYTRRDVWQRDDGESGEWEEDDLIGWTTDQADAEEAGKLFAQSQPRTIPTTCIETIDGDPDTALRLSFQINVF